LGELHSITAQGEESADSDQEEPGSSKRAAMLRTREDYLLDFEKSLLTLLKDLQRSIDQKITAAYLIMFLLLLIRAGSLVEVSVFGAKLNIDFERILIFSSVIFLTIYSLVTYQLHQLSFVYKALNDNASELERLNEFAITISRPRLDLFFSSSVGLVLSLTHLILLSAGLSLAGADPRLPHPPLSLLLPILVAIGILVFGTILFSLPLMTSAFLTYELVMSNTSGYSEGLLGSLILLAFLTFLTTGFGGYFCWIYNRSESRH